MIISNKSKEGFTPVEEGTWRAVCVDVTPLVKKERQYGVKEEFRIVFETNAAELSNGNRQCVWSRGFTPSLNEKSNLRKFLHQWRGRDLTETEENGLDTETLIGQPATLVIVHQHGDKGEVYANIVACIPYRGKDPLIPSGKFIRKKDRRENEDEKNNEKLGPLKTYENERKYTITRPKFEKLPEKKVELFTTTLQTVEEDNIPMESVVEVSVEEIRK